MAEALEFNWHCSDCTVDAALGYPRPGQCVIYKFSAQERRKGHGRRALQELRDTYSTIKAIEVGDTSNPNRAFWLEMGREGLIDVAIDFDGLFVWPIAKGAV